MFEHRAEQGLITTRLGTYEIIRALAKGGMAELFLARAVGPEGFEKLVVLKRILPHHAEDPKLVRSFIDEAKLVARLDHPHIAHVYDMGTLDGSYFFTMEYVHGPDVHAILRRCKLSGQPLAIEHAILIARDVASALHHAHERRGADGAELHIIHRDVSPSNIIISYDGVPKLVDFGIAKATSNSMRTQTGLLKGKISYMSPEQARGAQLDRRTDVFSLGIVLWEMVACRQLNKGAKDVAMLDRIKHKAAPSLLTERAECPPELARIVEKALALDPDARYATAQELELDLEELARENRLAQSRIGLSSAVHALFADEIRAWNEAQRAGPTLTNALPAAPRDGDDNDPVAPPPAGEPSPRRSLASTPVTMVYRGASQPVPLPPPPAAARPSKAARARWSRLPRRMRIAIAAAAAVAAAIVIVAVVVATTSGGEAAGQPAASPRPPDEVHATEADLPPAPAAAPVPEPPPKAARKPEPPRKPVPPKKAPPPKPRTIEPVTPRPAVPKYDPDALFPPTWPSQPSAGSPRS